jgi:transposase
VFGPGRSRQEQSDRLEPVPAEHESLTLKNVQAALSGRLRVSAATTSRGSTSFPARLPEFGTVYHYLQAWQNSAVWVHLHRVVYEQARRHTGRAACPSVVIMDGQSVKTTERGGARGSLNAPQSSAFCLD